ncbi:MAG: ATP synthase F0 subunit B [Polyangiaceae bacterium]
MPKRVSFWFGVVVTTTACGLAFAEPIHVEPGAQQAEAQLRAPIGEQARPAAEHDAHPDAAQAHDGQALGQSEPLTADQAAAQEHASGHGEHASGHGEHASGHGEHASGHGEHAEAPPKFSDINWYYGFFGEEEGATPSFAVRPKGMPVPFLATLLNWGILVALIVAFARKQIPSALAKRKAQIVQGMEEASKMLAESKGRLAELEGKLAKIDSEIERIRTEMARAGELERERILQEAVERRVRMERDAQRLIETELDAARESLRRFVVEKALASAKAQIAQRLRGEDQQRMFDDALASMKKLPSRSLGGQA